MLKSMADCRRGRYSLVKICKIVVGYDVAYRGEVGCCCCWLGVIGGIGGISVDGSDTFSLFFFGVVLFAAAALATRDANSSFN